MKHEPMTQERLDAIQARVDAATWTEGEPWDYAEDDWGGWCVSICDSGFGTAYVAKDIVQGEDEGKSDAALIAHAPPRPRGPARGGPASQALRVHRVMAVRGHHRRAGTGGHGGAGGGDPLRARLPALELVGH